MHSVPHYEELLSTLLEAVSHEVRTPLSVVTNTLSYLIAPGQEEDLKRAHERAFDVAAVLKDAALPDPTEKTQTVNIQRLLDEALWAFPIKWIKRAGEGVVTEKRGWLWLTLTEIARVVEDSKDADTPIEATFIGEPTLKLSLKAKVTKDSLQSFEENGVASFARLRTQGLPISAVRAARLDILCARQDVVTSLTDGCLSIAVGFRNASL
jgi:hypothetical protein